MQKGELVIKPTLKVMLFYYRTLYASRGIKGSYQGNIMINLVLLIFPIPAVFLLFYNVYYGIFVFLIGLFFVILQDLYVRFSPNKIRYIISQNEVRMIDELNNKNETMFLGNKLDIEILPTFIRSEIYDFRNMVLKTENDRFCLFGIPEDSVQEILDFLKTKDSISNFKDKESEKFLVAKTINTKMYVLIALFINIILVFLIFNISVIETVKTDMLRMVLFALITSEIIFYFILRLLYK